MITESKKRDVALIVDDSPETLRLLTDALDGAGMTVMVALDGAAADRVMNAGMKMKKFDLDALNRAYAGQG